MQDKQFLIQDKQLVFEYKAFNGLFDDLNSKIVMEFLEFHEHNPAIFQLFRKFASEARSSGRKHYGAKAIMEKIRWEVEITQRGEFKVNNNFVSGFVRLLIFLDPTFKDFFERRNTPRILEVQ